MNPSNPDRKLIASAWPLWRIAFSFAFMAFALCGMKASFAAEPEVVATGLQFPEGTIFVGNTLYFVDYSTSDVLRLVDRKVEKVWHQDGCGANGLVQVPQGLLVACYENGTVVRISLAGKTEETISGDDKGRPFIAPNDLAADARGGVYFTGSGSGSSLGKVYYRSVDKRVREVAANIRNANGLVVSLDGKILYLAESAANRLLAFDIAADGALSGQREFVKLGDILSAPGQATFTPDGVRIDKRGNLFIGLYRGGGFAVVSPAAKLLAFVSVPEPHHANLAIAPDGRSVFLTATRDALGGSYVGQLMRVPNPVAE
jgi:gluconolactonase